MYAYEEENSPKNDDWKTLNKYLKKEKQNRMQLSLYFSVLLKKGNI